MCHAVSTQSPDILFVVVQWSRFVCRYILSHTLSPTSPKASSCRAYRWLHCHMLGGCQNWEYRSALPKLETKSKFRGGLRSAEKFMYM